MNRISFVRKLKQFLTLENFMNIQLLFGFYRKFHSTKWNVMGHFYCIAYFISLSSIAVYCLIFIANSYNKIPMVLHLVTFIVLTIFSLLTKRQYLLIYVSRLKSFDKIVNYKSVNFDPYFSFGIYFLLIFNLVTDAMFYCLSSINVITAIVMVILKTSNIFTIAPSVLIFNLFRNRMKFIRYKLGKINENHFTTDEKCHTIKKFMLVYKYLLDNFRQVSNHIKFTVNNATCSDQLYSFRISNSSTYSTLRCNTILIDTSSKIHNMEDFSTRYESNDGFHKPFNWIYYCFNFILLLASSTIVTTSGEYNVHRHNSTYSTLRCNTILIDTSSKIHNMEDSSTRYEFNDGFHKPFNWIYYCFNFILLLAGST
ncbi:unnamed protein product, partial [Leptidea sinapis]